MEVVATNKKAYRDYDLRDRWEAGIVLSGGEVKSLRAGEADLSGAFVRVEEGEAFLYHCFIKPYEQRGYADEKPDRVRKLLLHKKEIHRIEAAVRQKGMAVVPTRLYFNRRGLAKVEIAAGKGKKLIDKREDIKKRSTELALKRAVKHKR